MVDEWALVWITKPAKDSKMYHDVPDCPRLAGGRGMVNGENRPVKDIRMGSALAAGRKPCPDCVK